MKRIHYCSTYFLVDVVDLGTGAYCAYCTNCCNEADSSVNERQDKDIHNLTDEVNELRKMVETLAELRNFTSLPKVTTLSTQPGNQSQPELFIKHLQLFKFA